MSFVGSLQMAIFTSNSATYFSHGAHGAHGEFVELVFVHCPSRPFEIVKAISPSSAIALAKADPL
jgi:hypothetical protein